MFNKKSTESVLKEIYEAYPDAFADGRRLSGLFADFSGGQLRAQKNQLDIFLKCGGNTRILALRDEAPRKQQREYHRLVGEMTDTYGMQQELALEISSTFWKTALGTQAPAMGGQEKKEKSASEKPSEKPSEMPSEKQPARQKRQQNAVLASAGKHWQGMSIFARIMFVIGLYGAISYAIALVLVFTGVAEIGRLVVADTDGTLSVLTCLVHFPLYVWYLFRLFSNEEAGYLGVYGALVSKISPRPKLADYPLIILIKFVGTFVICLYMVGGFNLPLCFRLNATWDGTWVGFLAYGLLAYGFFTFVWVWWRLIACKKYEPYYRK